MRMTELGGVCFHVRPVRHRHRPTVFSFYVRGAEIKRESTFRADKGNDWRQSGPVSECSSIGRICPVGRNGIEWGRASTPRDRRSLVRLPPLIHGLAACGGTCQAILRVAYCEFLSN